MKGLTMRKKALKRKLPAMPRENTNYKPGRILDLGDDQCRFVIGDRYLMCGALVDYHGSSWCAEHRARITQPKEQANG
jgi:hypothetical protein